MRSRIILMGLLASVFLLSSLDLLAYRGGGGGGFDRGGGGGGYDRGAGGGQYDRGGSQGDYNRGYGSTSYDKGYSQGYDRGFNHGNDPYWTNHRYTDPAAYYGTTGVNSWYYGQVLGGANPPEGSQPGMSDDSDALYNSYLQSNPPIPY